MYSGKLLSRAPLRKHDRCRKPERNRGSVIRGRGDYHEVPPWHLKSSRLLQPECLCYRGVRVRVRIVFDYEWTEAERCLKKTLELSPNSAEVYDHYSWLCASVELYEGAVRHVTHARELDALLVQSEYTTILLRAGHLEEALTSARR